jgi:RNA polymerase sigma-70 factor (ECF subfamily)
MAPCELSPGARSAGAAQPHPIARDEGTATELRGADEVAKEIEVNRARAAFASVLLVDRVPGAVVAPLGRLRFVLRFTLADERCRAG